MNIAPMRTWAQRAMLPLAVLLFVDLCLDWHRATVSIAGALDVHGETSALAGWGLLAAVVVGGLIVWEVLRTSGRGPARQGAEGLSAALALCAFAFTAIEFFSGSATVDAGGVVDINADVLLWPAYAGLALGAMLALAGVAQLGRPVGTAAKRLRPRMQ